MESYIPISAEATFSFNELKIPMILKTT